VFLVALRVYAEIRSIMLAADYLASLEGEIAKSSGNIYGDIGWENYLRRVRLGIKKVDSNHAHETVPKNEASDKKTVEAPVAVTASDKWDKMYTWQKVLKIGSVRFLTQGLIMLAVLGASLFLFLYESRLPSG
jgi:hypothetical protein